MKKTIATSLIVLLLSSAGVFPQNEFGTDYDAYIRKVMHRVPDIPSIAVVVVKDDKPIFVRAYGTADKEAGIKADIDTLFYIASSTKSFTALAAALLDKEGKIKFGDSITKYAAGIPLKTAIPDKVTIKDLLTHTSGLENDALTFRMAFSGEGDAKEMARVFGQGTTYSDAGHGKYRYANLGYNIYGVLLQNYLHQKWQDVLQKRIFDPLGMKHSTANISRAPAKKWSVAAPYYFSGPDGKMIRSPLPKQDNNMQSAGGLFVSISDMGRWLAMNMNGGELNGKQVISADIINAAHTGYTKTTREEPSFSAEGEYGLGWHIGKYKNEKVIYQHGGFEGYRSHMSFMPDKKIGVAVLSNDGIAGVKAVELLAIYPYDRLLGTPNVEVDYSKRLEDFATAYEKMTQQMVNAAANRAKRTSQLTKPLASYTGRYINDLYGTIEITSDGKDLTVKMGNIRTVATPFTQKETIRVEMFPGTGDVMKFTADDKGNVVSLNWADMVFMKR